MSGLLWGSISGVLFASLAVISILYNAINYDTIKQFVFGWFGGFGVVFGLFLVLAYMFGAVWK